MTPEELQEVVAAVIAALKTNGKTIDQLTAVTSLADTDNLEISNGKKVSFGKLKELVADAVVVSPEEIKGWEIIDSTDDLPENPTQVQQEKAYVLPDVSTMYVYVGAGGDTLDGKYRSVQLKGPKGDKGDSGVHLGDVALVNDLETGGEESALTAEMGKELKGMIDSQEKEINGDEVQNYIKGYYYKSDGTLVAYQDFAIQTDYTPVTDGDTVTFNSGVVNSSACLCLYHSDKSFLGYYGCSSAPRTITLPTQNIAYVRLSFAVAKKDEAYIDVNNVRVWQPVDSFVSIKSATESVQRLIGGEFPITQSPVEVFFNLGYIDKNNGIIYTSTINSCSQRIDVTGYERVRFVGNRNSSITDDCAAFYDKNGDFLSAISYYDPATSINTYKTYDVEIPSEAKYFSFTLQNAFAEHAFCELSLTTIIEQLNAIKKDAKVWEDGYQIFTNEGVGNTCRLQKFESESFRCFRVECTAGDKVFIARAKGGISPRLWCFLDASNVILSVADESAVADGLELTAPAGTAWLICNDTQKKADVYVYEGEKPLNVKVDWLALKQGEQMLKARTSNCKDFGTQPAANGTDGSFCDVKNGSYQDLLASVYEPLRQSFPNYIKRVNIGKDASGTIDMYAYVFEPRYYQQSVYLQAGIHGIEVDAVACLARIMYLIANATNSDEDLMYLRQTVKFTVIPCVNVWGFSQSPKNNNNSNNAALQQWSSLTPPQEIANIKAYIEAESLTDELSYMLDMHTTTNNTYYDFYGNIQRHAKNVRTIYRTNAWLCDNYAQDGRTVDDQYLGYYEPANNILFRQYYYYNYGVQTATLELSDYHWDNALSTSRVISMGVTMWLNYIVQMVNDFYVLMSDIPSADYRPSRG
jgi:lambda repressor-like predicted transcriptional regulator